jgi:hypothetical protein
LIALTVEEGKDWTDVQIPALESASAPAKPEVAAEAAPIAPSTSAEPAELHFVPGIGPATNLLLAQYGIDPRLVTRQDGAS